MKGCAEHPLFQRNENNMPYSWNVAEVLPDALLSPALSHSFPIPITKTIPYPAQVQTLVRDLRLKFLSEIILNNI